MPVFLQSSSSSFCALAVMAMMIVFFRLVTIMNQDIFSCFKTVHFGHLNTYKNQIVSVFFCHLKFHFSNLGNICCISKVLQQADYDQLFIKLSSATSIFKSRL